MATTGTLWHRLPWRSLWLLAFTHAVFGWLIFPDLVFWPWWLWLGALSIIAIVCVLFIPIDLARRSIQKWLKSKFRATLTLLSCIFVFVLLIFWLGLSVRFIALTATAAMVRIDLIERGLRKSYAFILLMTTALGSYGLGIIAHKYSQVLL